jgi:hypothetical protein
VETAVPRCSIPSGATPGSKAAAAGCSNAVAAPNTTKAANISGTVSHPAKLPQAKNTAASPSAIWHTCRTRLRS